MLKIDLNKQAKEILEIAEKHGVKQNFFFLTTFKRYQVQIGILNDLEITIREERTLVTKNMSKGRKTHIPTLQYLIITEQSKAPTKQL